MESPLSSLSAGSDYIGTSATLSFGPSAASQHCHDVTILDDTSVEFTETFNVTLRFADLADLVARGLGGRLSLQPMLSTVSITDNDECECVCMCMCVILTRLVIRFYCYMTQ